MEPGYTVSGSVLKDFRTDSFYKTGNIVASVKTILCGFVSTVLNGETRLASVIQFTYYHWRDAF